MSYILDAIRKADQKRKLGSVPDVNTVHEAPIVDPRRPAWVYGLAAVLLVNAALIGWWLWGGKAKAPVARKGQDKAAVEQAAAVAKAPAPAVQAGPGSAPPVAAPGGRPVRPGQPPAAQPGQQVASQPVAALPAAPGGQAAPSTAARSTAPPPQALGAPAGPAKKGMAARPGAPAGPPPASPAVQAPAAAAAGNAAGAPSTPAAAAQVVPVVKEGAPPPTSPGEAPAGAENPEEPIATPEAGVATAEEGKAEEVKAEEAKAETAATGPQALAPIAVGKAPPAKKDKVKKEAQPEEDPELVKIPLLKQLPADVQQAMPELRLSFHSYSIRPEARLVSIGGKVLREGQSLDEDTKLETITPKGVVMVVKGRRFRLNME